MQSRGLLIVCGPSGSGKSTFIGQIASGTLPWYIKAQLPSHCCDWPEVHARLFIEFLQDRQQADRSRAILHYDLNFGIRSGLDGFTDEPAAQAIFSFETATIVKIVAPPARLWAQYARRMFGGQTLKETTRNVVFLTDSEPRTRQARMFLDLYIQPGWLVERWRLWDEFLEKLGRRVRISNEICVHPWGDIYAQAAPVWRLDQS
jgi:hypothetical protein